MKKYFSLKKGPPGKSGQVWVWLGMPEHLTKSSSLKCYLSLVKISLQKIKYTDVLIPEVLMIKESCNLIG